MDRLDVSIGSAGGSDSDCGDWDKKQLVCQILLLIDANTVGDGEKFSSPLKQKSRFATFWNKVAMKTTGLLNSFFLISVRSIVQDFLRFFRFTEADASALLSAYGLHALEVDRLQNNRPNEQKETSGSLEKVSHRKRIDQPPGPIPIGVHPDFTLGNWATTSRKHVQL